MGKYGVILARGEEITILEICGSKEAVIVASQVQKRLHSREKGCVTAIEGEFDAQGT